MRWKSNLYGLSLLEKTEIIIDTGFFNMMDEFLLRVATLWCGVTTQPRKKYEWIIDVIVPSVYLSDVYTITHYCFWYQVDLLMGSLNPKGEREKALHKQLEEHHLTIWLCHWTFLAFNSCASVLFWLYAFRLVLFVLKRMLCYICVVNFSQHYNISFYEMQQGFGEEIEKHYCGWWVWASEVRESSLSTKGYSRGILSQIC